MTCGKYTNSPVFLFLIHTKTAPEGAVIYACYVLANGRNLKFQAEATANHLVGFNHIT